MATRIIDERFRVRLGREHSVANRLDDKTMPKFSISRKRFRPRERRGKLDRATRLLDPLCLDYGMLQRTPSDLHSDEAVEGAKRAANQTLQQLSACFLRRAPASRPRWGWYLVRGHAGTVVGCQVLAFRGHIVYSYLLR